MRSIPPGEEVRVAIDEDDSSDTVRITPDPRGEIVPEWDFQEEFRLGLSEDGEQVFRNEYLALRFRSDSSILVNSYYGGRVVLFDSSGEFVEEIAEPGKGPGELESPTSIGLDQRGNLWVANAFSGRYTEFDAEGDFLRTVPRPFHAYVQRQKLLIFVDSEDGHFIDQSADINGRHVTINFSLMDSVGQVVRMYPSLPIKPFQSRDLGLIPGTFDMGRAPDYYTFTVFNIDSAGIWFGTSDKLEIIRRTWAGDTTVVIQGEHRSAELTADDRRAIKTSIGREGFSWDDFYFSRPIMQRIDPMPDGGVMVQLSTGVRREGSPFYEVYSGEGHLVGTVEFPLPVSTQAVPAFQGDRIAVVGMGEFDEPIVLVGRLVPAAE